MKFFKNKLAVTVIVLSVAFLGIIIFTVKSDSKNPISGGVGTVLNPVQKVVYTISDKVHDVFDFFYNFSDVKNENNDLKKKTGKYSRSYSYFPPNSERICKIQEIHSVDSHILMFFYAFAGKCIFLC